jgi:hypothetical protein
MRVEGVSKRSVFCIPDFNELAIFLIFSGGGESESQEHETCFRPVKWVARGMGQRTKLITFHSLVM